MDPYAHLLPTPTGPDEPARIESLVKAAGTSFYWGMRLLPRDRRDGMFAVYAFARAVDDIADEGGSETRKREGLAAWRAEIERVYQGTPQTLIGRALALTVTRFGTRKQDFIGLIDGMEMDAVEAIQAPPFEKLDLYCYRVACTVGLLSVRIFGAPEGDGDAVAEALGRALQLTNILRDVHEDAERDRLYLPRELLQRHGITVTQPASVLADPRLPAVCAELAETAAGRFEEAEAAMARCPRESMRPARIMMEMYRRYLVRLRADGWRDLKADISLPKPCKLWIVLRHGLL